MPEKCHVIGCSQPVVAKGLCRKHYMRVARTGEVDDSRPSDWGKREKHPAYRAWCNLRRHYLQEMSSEWRDDFWQFAKDIPDKPEESTAHRPEPSLHWSKDNFYWKEKRSSSEDVKGYAKDWHRKSRLANPEYYINQDLQRNYGVSLEWYENTLREQNNVCAICKQLETTIIRGKLIAMSVDHSHDTGKVRGLLCTQCNRGLGLFKDNLEVLQSAISYLRNKNG